MRWHCILRCIAVHLFGIVWAPRLIYKDTMYRSNTPELFWSNTSVVVSLFSELVPSSVNTLLLTLEQFSSHSCPLFIIVAHRRRAHSSLRTLNTPSTPAPIRFYYHLPTGSRRIQEWMIPHRSMTSCTRTMGFRCPRCRQCLPHFHPAQERPH